MDVTRLVERARAGDVDAFTDLVRGYQAMAFGYAWATTRDRDLAEDAAQQAFITAWQNLPGLREPARFGGWLRGIVRFECLHLLRRRNARTVSLDHTTGLASAGPGPAEVTEDRDGLERALAAIHALPEAERIAAVLYYVHDHSQREVAEFLNLPVTTVNNRLRNARKRLREGGLAPMANDAFRSHALPHDFADRIGAVIRASGNVVDARFDAGQRPPVLNQVAITDGPSGRSLTAQVAQYLDDDLVRCIVLADEPSGAAAPGAQVRDLQEPTSLPLDLAALHGVVDRFVRPSPPTEIVETGIKAIDLTCPLPAGGLIGLAGDMQTGKMVLVEELIHRLGSLPQPISILVFVEATAEVAAVQQLDYRTSGSVEAIYLPVANTSPEPLAPILDRLDAVITLSRDLGKQRLYPAIDPLRSGSRLLDPAIVGPDHVAAVDDLRQLLRDAPQSERATLARQYLSQPFHVAEGFTNRPGVAVPRATTVADVRSLLDGSRSGLAPETLYMTGALGQPTT